MKRVAAAVLLAGLIALPSTARAYVVGIDLNAAFRTGSSDNGFGAALRLGTQLPLPGALAILEAGGATHGFSTSNINQLFVGGRLGVGAFLRPSVYGHVGYGWLNPITATTQTVLISSQEGGSGLYLEGGFALDLVLAPVSIGAHVAYDSFVQGDFQAKPRFLLVGILASVNL